MACPAEDVGELHHGDMNLNALQFYLVLAVFLALVSAAVAISRAFPKQPKTSVELWRALLLLTLVLGTGLLVTTILQLRDVSP